MSGGEVALTIAITLVVLDTLMDIRREQKRTADALWTIWHEMKERGNAPPA